VLEFTVSSDECGIIGDLELPLKIKISDYSQKEGRGDLFKGSRRLSTWR
jgi:hypothetical protein